MSDPLRIAFLLFPNVTQLDLTGPAQFLARIGRIDLVAGSRDPVATDAGFAILPTATDDEVPATDILCVPGGMGVTDAIRDDAALGWVKRVGGEAAWVTSVCTGALILGAAGLLQGYRATTHWAWHHLLPLFGAEPVRARTVVDRNRATGGGVTAGIDFALCLIAEVKGDDAARLLQLSFEYDPQPPFGDGSPDRADPSVRARYDATAARTMPGREATLREVAARRGFS